MAFLFTGIAVVGIIEMLGVILWKDESRNKAVVWCEDHANLAFISDLAGEGAGDATMNVGDLIRFELTVHNNTRFAANPCLVQQNQYPGLSDRLSDTVVQLYGKDDQPKSAEVRVLRRGAA